MSRVPTSGVPWDWTFSTKSRHVSSGRTTVNCPCRPGRLGQASHVCPSFSRVRTHRQFAQHRPQGAGGVARISSLVSRMASPAGCCDPCPVPVARGGSGPLWALHSGVPLHALRTTLHDSAWSLLASCEVVYIINDVSQNSKRIVKFFGCVSPCHAGSSGGWVRKWAGGRGSRRAARVARRSKGAQDVEAWKRRCVEAFGRVASLGLEPSRPPTERLAQGRREAFLRRSCVPARHKPVQESSNYEIHEQTTTQTRSARRAVGWGLPHRFLQPKETKECERKGKEARVRRCVRNRIVLGQNASTLLRLDASTRRPAAFSPCPPLRLRLQSV